MSKKAIQGWSYYLFAGLGLLLSTAATTRGVVLIPNLCAPFAEWVDTKIDGNRVELKCKHKQTIYYEVYYK